MTNSNTGGMAFPLPGIEGQPVNEGMTLLDYFAGKALAGLTTIPDERGYKENPQQTVEQWREELYAQDAKYCYELAKAMIAEKHRREGKDGS